jgi:hypothetical protein
MFPHISWISGSCPDFQPKSIGTSWQKRGSKTKKPI